MLPNFDEVKPLTPDDWFRYVMVPEIGRMLVEQDMYGGRMAAWHLEATAERDMSWKVLVQSRLYGSLRFGEGSDYDTSDPDWIRESKRVATTKVAHIDLT